MADAVAAALNNLKANDVDEEQLQDLRRRPAPSPASRGCFAAWTAETTAFPSPSMYGSGDRVSICWAVFGRLPTSRPGSLPRRRKLYHACQGLELSGTRSGVRARRSLPFLPRLEHLQGRGRLRLRPGAGQSAQCSPQSFARPSESDPAVAGSGGAYQAGLQRPFGQYVRELRRLRRSHLGLAALPHS